MTDRGGFDERLFETLARAEEASFWFRSRNRLIVWALGRYFPGARSVLEVGCGTGFVLAALRRARPELALTGVELFDAGLAVARRRLPDVRLLEHDVRALPFESEFDVVAAFDVLEHVAEDEQALARLFRAARPGGGIVVTVPQHPRLWSAFDEVSRHERRYVRRELVRKVEGAGFRVLRVTSFVSLLLPLLALERLRHRRGSEAYDPLAQLRLPRRLDRALERVMDLERALIERGLSFPAGGSLLLVAARPA